MIVFDLVEFTLLSGIAYIVARYFFGSSKYYNMKRLYILSVIPILWFLSFTSFGITTTNIVENIPFLPEVLVTPNKVIETGITVSWLLIVYLVGVVFSLTHKLVGVTKIKRIIKNSILIKVQNDTRIYENNEGLSFCFWQTISVAKSENQAILIDHELEHIANKHHFDLLLSNLYSIVFWFNPFTYLMTKELQATHEFQVDSNANYKLSEIVPNLNRNKNVIAITSNHNFINYKRRIEMKTSKSKHILSIMAGIMLTLFAIGISAVTSHSVIADEITSTDKVPTYKGNMMAELSNEIKYPKSAYENKVEGKVIVKIKIDNEGNQTATEVEYSSGNAELDNEAVRAVKTLESWESGTVGGKAIAAWVQIPVKFKLPK